MILPLVRSHPNTSRIRHSLTPLTPLPYKGMGEKFIPTLAGEGMFALVNREVLDRIPQSFAFVPRNAGDLAHTFYLGFPT